MNTRSFQLNSILLFGLLVLSSQSGFAHEIHETENSIPVNSDHIQILGKLDGCCGSYYSSITGHFVVNYENIEISREAEVFLVYGFKKVLIGTEIKTLNDWYLKNEIKLTPIASQRWHASFNQTLAMRSSPSTLDNLQFALKIVHSDGSEYWDKGSDSTWGFYEAAPLISVNYRTAPYSCIENSQDAEGFCSLKLKAVTRH